LRPNSLPNLKEKAYTKGDGAHSLDS
jgi:hypothetical protein